MPTIQDLNQRIKLIFGSRNEIPRFHVAGNPGNYVVYQNVEENNELFTIPFFSCPKDMQILSEEYVLNRLYHELSKTNKQKLDEINEKHKKHLQNLEEEFTYNVKDKVKTFMNKNC